MSKTYVTPLGTLTEFQIEQYAIQYGTRKAAEMLDIPKSTVSDIKKRVRKHRGLTDGIMGLPHILCDTPTTGPSEFRGVQTLEPTAESSVDDTLKQENTMLRGQLSTRKRQEHGIIRAINNVFDRHPRITLNVVTLPASSERPYDRNKPSHVPAMVLSDTQIGKNVGGYNTDEARRRIRSLAVKQLRVLEVMSAGANIPYVEIWLGGDMVEGERIFPNQPYEIEYGAGEQACVHAPWILAEYILTFAAAGYQVKVRSTKGNHGRVATPRDPASESANWDYVCYHVLKHVLDASPYSEQIEWPDGVSKHWYTIVPMPGGWNVLLTHGDMISGGGTSGSIEKKVQGWLNGAIPKPFDYVVMGHFHRGIEWPVGTCEVIVNGTTETPESSFLQGVVGSTNRSFQRMLVFHEEHGLIDNKKFYLDGHHPRGGRK